MKLKITEASTEDLLGIQQLQQQNHKEALEKEDVNKEGFVTIHHSHEMLQKINKPFPHTIIKDEDLIVAYALSMLPIHAEIVPDLNTMIKYASMVLKEKSYIIMGQICVHKNYRQQGLFRALYNKMRDRFQDKFNYIVTDIDSENQRSLKAHLAIGFRVIYQYKSDIGKEWNVVALKIS